MRRPHGPSRARDRWIARSHFGLWWLWKWWRWGGISLPYIKRPDAAAWLHVGSFGPEEKSKVKKPTIGAEGDDLSAFGIQSSKLLVKHALVNDFLTAGTWEDLSPKGQRCLMMFVEGATVRVLIKVENPPLKLSVVGRSIDEALAALDAVLTTGDTPWEQDIPRQSPPRRKRS